MDHLNLVNPVVEIARKAAEKIMQIYLQKDPIRVEKKANQTPLTEADILSNNIIVPALKALTPDYPVLSEEGEQFDYNIRKNWTTYWLIDPLDGTREFIHKTDDFCVNIALIQDFTPVLGVVFSPVAKTCYTSCLGHSAIFRNAEGDEQTITTSPWPDANPVRVILSRHAKTDTLAKFFENIGRHEVKVQGSGLKFCSIAKGAAEIYPRLGPISEWDTAAGQCILECAGGAVFDFEGNSLQYNTKDDLLQPSFWAVSNKEAALKILQHWR